MIDFAEAGGLWYYGHIHGLTEGDAGVPDAPPPGATTYVRKDGGAGEPVFLTKSANNLTRGNPCQFGIPVPRPRKPGFRVCSHTVQYGDSHAIRASCRWITP